MIGEDGRITSEAPERFVGMTVAEAQRAVVAELTEQGLIARTEPYTHDVPFSQRSGERIEPLISLQWFMAMEELAAAGDRGGDQRPDHASTPRTTPRVYLDWMENIRPWCICRQLWWGHRLPVWYRGPETYVGIEPPRGEGWTRDPDVLDTWFSSALWPFVTLGWPDDTPELEAFYPTDVLVTARDIVFLWVARMIMMGLEFTGEIPFSDVYVHSIIQAPDGRRMSKSLGTGIDPLDLIEGGPRPPVFAAGRANSRPTAPTRCAGACWPCPRARTCASARTRSPRAQQLTNKLWNAARLILLGVERVATDIRGQRRPVAVEDRWILSRLERAKAEVAARIERYDFSHAALALYDFVYRRAVRLVPGAGQAAAARRRPRAGRHPAVRAHRDGHPRASADPVRDRGDLLAHPRRRGPAGGASGGARRRTSTSWPNGPSAP